MPADVTLASAFLVGLLGSTHCLGMCGGIVGALTLGLKEDIRRSPTRLAPYLLAYNLGRIVTYAIAGAAVGYVSAQILRVAPPAEARLVSKLVSGGFMLLLGFYLAGWWPALGALEKLGGKLWARIEPFGRKLLPVNHPLKALGFGLIWGWLPCGMVYAALAWALASGNAADGALLMTAFGLGTLPMLFALGAAARWLHQFVQQPWVRRGAGILVILFGLYTLFAPGGYSGHGGGHAGQRSAGIHTHHAH
jgi:sulfite exporter TauE/SafE